MNPNSSNSTSPIFCDLPTLQTPRLILRKMTLDDARDMFAYARDPEISRFTLWEHHRTIDDTLCFLRGVIQNYAACDTENWGIVLNETNKLIGTCGFFAWDREHFKASIHYALSLASSGKGLMTEAVKEIIRFGFEKMTLNRIEAHCMVANVASERVMQKAGMHFEGISRKLLFSKGAFHDVKVYSILRVEWKLT